MGWQHRNDKETLQAIITKAAMNNTSLKKIGIKIKTDLKFNFQILNFFKRAKKQVMITLRGMAEHRFSNVYYYQCVASAASPIGKFPILLS